jgi:hypothetical protein
MFLHKHISANNVPLEEFPFIRELAMEAYLVENETALSLQIEGFDDVKVVESEAHLRGGGEGEGKDGRTDILATYGAEYIAVIELKLGRLTQDHVTQISRYLGQREQILTDYPQVWDKNVGAPKWIGVMVGDSIDPSLAKAIREGLLVEISRFRGKNDGNTYVVTDTYFVDKVKGRDYTKYQFNGRSYNKRKLVLAVIENYVKNNPDITYGALQVMFPNTLQGGHTFVHSDQAQPSYCYFGSKDDLIQLKDALIAVNNQWGIENITSFLRRCTELEITIMKIPN